MERKEGEKEVREPVWPEVCTQPQCMLRDKAFDSEFAAEVIVRLLSGQDLSKVLPEARRIIPFDRCYRCALSVIRDGRPIATPEELKELVAAGRRSYRRHRRASRRA